MLPIFPFSILQDGDFYPPPFKISRVILAKKSIILYNKIIHSAPFPCPWPGRGAKGGFDCFQL